MPIRARLISPKTAATGTESVTAATRRSGRTSSSAPAGLRPPCVAWMSAGSKLSGRPRAVVPGASRRLRLRVLDAVEAEASVCLCLAVMHQIQHAPLRAGHRQGRHAARRHAVHATPVRDRQRRRQAAVARKSRGRVVMTQCLGPEIGTRADTVPRSPSIGQPTTTGRCCGAQGDFGAALAVRAPLGGAADRGLPVKWPACRLRGRAPDVASARNRCAPERVL